MHAPCRPAAPAPDPCCLQLILGRLQYDFQHRLLVFGFSFLLEFFSGRLQYDFQHRLLAFLYAAARAPLSTHYTGGPLVDFLEVQASVLCLCWPSV